MKIPNSSRCCESYTALRHLLSLGVAPWEGIVGQDESEDLPSVYNEIMPAANGRVCDLSFSRVHIGVAYGISVGEYPLDCRLCIVVAVH